MTPSPLAPETKKALCIACTLAEVMKDCKACAFNSGLPARLEWLKGKAAKDNTVSIQRKESTNEQ